MMRPEVLPLTTRGGWLLPISTINACRSCLGAVCGCRLREQTTTPKNRACFVTQLFTNRDYL